MRTKILFYFSILACVGLLSYSGFALASPEYRPVRVHLDPATQLKGFTLVSSDALFSFGIQANSLPERKRIRVTLKRRDKLTKPMKKNGETLYSPIYSFDVYNKKTVWPTKALWLKVKYTDTSITVPLSLAYWDAGAKTWDILSSTQDTSAQTVSAGITFPYAQIALIQTPAAPVLETGKASWYHSDVAAHLTLPFGTLVKVTNTDNGESVVVKIGDRGPYIAGRVIDLPKTAFEQIASISAGVIPVTLQLVTP